MNSSRAKELPEGKAVNTDIRRGLPSASSAVRYALCPGSFLLEKRMPYDLPSEAAASGTRIHEAISGKVPIELDDNEREIYDRCVAQEVEVRRTAGFNAPDYTFREERMWMSDENGTPLWSGEPDALFITGTSGLVLDYKTGRGDVWEASVNLQLRALAVLAVENYSLTEITVAIIQPLAGKPTIARYTFSDLLVAVAEVSEVMARIKEPNQPRTPSEDACKYCRAKAICPEAQQAVAVIVSTQESAIIDPQELGRFLELAPVALKVIEARKDQAKSFIEAGGVIPGWKLKPGSLVEKITKPEVVWERCERLGMPSEGFMSLLKITKGALKTAIGSVTMEKGKGLAATVDSILEGCTEETQNAPSLVREDK